MKNRLHSDSPTEYHDIPQYNHYGSALFINLCCYYSIESYIRECFENDEKIVQLKQLTNFTL